MTEQNKITAIQISGQSDSLANFLSKSPAHLKNEISQALISRSESFGMISNPLRKLQEIQTSIEKNVEIHFGIRPGLLSDELLKAVIGEIALRFSDLSCDDIDFAFERYVEPRDKWTNITKREILDPVQKWKNNRYQIQQEFRKHQREKDEELKRIEEAKIFENESLKIYRESISAGEWLGDIFNAHAIAKKYLSDKLDQKAKSNLWKEAQYEFKELRVNFENNPKDHVFSMAGVSELRIFSRKIVEACIDLSIEI